MTTLAKGLAVLGAFGRAAADHDPVGSGRGRRPVARDRAARAAHARRARLCRAGRPAVLAVAAHPRARLRLSVDAELDRPRAAADEGAERAARRILLGRDPAGQRHRLCRAHAGAPHHVGGAVGRQPAAGVPHRARARPARLSRRGRDLAAAEVAAHRGLHAAHHHRPAGAVRPHPRRPRAGLFHRRRGARARPARARRADPRPQRAGGRRHQPVDALDAHHPQRNARALSPRAQSHRRAGRLDDRSDASAPASLANRRGRSRIVAPSSEYAHKFDNRTNQGETRWQARRKATAAQARPEHTGNVEVDAPADRRRISGVAARRPRGLHLRRAGQGRHHASGLPQHRAHGRPPLRRAARRQAQGQDSCCRPTPAMAA